MYKSAWRFCSIHLHFQRTNWTIFSIGWLIENISLNNAIMQSYINIIKLNLEFSYYKLNIKAFSYAIRQPRYSNFPSSIDIQLLRTFNKRQNLEKCIIYKQKNIFIPFHLCQIQKLQKWKIFKFHLFKVLKPFPFAWICRILNIYKGVEYKLKYSNGNIILCIKLVELNDIFNLSRNVTFQYFTYIFLDLKLTVIR